MREFAGKVAIVTGGGRGIGRSEALFLASRGAAVVVSDRGGLINGEPAPSSLANRVVEEIRAAHGRAEANFADVSVWSSAQELIAQTLDHFGRLDILVCNAGIVRDYLKNDVTEAEWDAVMEAHLKAYFAPTHFAAEHWRAVHRETDAPVNGRIVYTSAEADLYGNLGHANYSAAKGGVIGLCLEVSRELQSPGCTVNTILSRAQVPLDHASLGQRAISRDDCDPRHTDTLARWAGFLASDVAAKVTGQVFAVNGGTIARMHGWVASTQITQQGRWTLENLTERAHDLIPGLEASAQPFAESGAGGALHQGSRAGIDPTPP